MDDLHHAFVLVLIPASVALAGGLSVELFAVSQAALNVVLHFAAGVVLGIVGVELIPQSMQTEMPWLIVLIYLIGGAAFMAVNLLTDFVEDVFGEQAVHAPWVIMIGIAIDLVTDGMMVTAGSRLGHVGLAIAVALGLVEVVECFATMATFRQQKVARKILVPVAFGFFGLILLGVPLGYGMIHGRPMVVTYGILSFTAGYLSLLMIEEMIPRAHKGRHAHLSTFLFIVGFAMVALVSAYM